MSSSSNGSELVVKSTFLLGFLFEAVSTSVETRLLDDEVRILLFLLNHLLCDVIVVNVVSSRGRIHLLPNKARSLARLGLESSATSGDGLRINLNDRVIVAWTHFILLRLLKPFIS